MFLNLFFFVFSAHLCFPVLFSESECSMERPSVMSSPVRSDLCTFVAFCADPDPHLLGLPDLHLPFGQTTALVHSLDTIYRVSPYKTYQSTWNQQQKYNLKNIIVKIIWGLLHYVQGCTVWHSMFSSHQVSATSHRTSMHQTKMTQRWMITTSKTLRTPASSMSPASSILLLPSFSQRGNPSDSLATRIVRNLHWHYQVWHKKAFSVEK